MQKASQLCRQALPVLGMATVWPSVFNQLLYPVSFTFYNTGDSTAYLFYIVYSVLLIGITTAFAVSYRQIDRAILTKGTLVCVFGVLGALGILLLSQLDFSTIASTVGIGLGISFSALFLPIHFLFWSMRFAEDKARTIPTKMALSLVLFAVFTGIRLTLGIHALEVSVTFPLVSSLLAFIVLRSADSKANCTGKFEIRALPYGFIVPCLLFIALCNFGILLFNIEAQLQYSPPSRAMLYFVVAACFIVVAFLYSSANKRRRGATIVVFSLVSIVFIACAFIAVLLSDEVLAVGTVPLISANTCLVGFLWILCLMDANRRHASPTLPMALLLTIAVFIPRFMRASFMFENTHTAVVPSTMQLFAISAGTALISVVVVIVAMMNFFWKTELGKRPGQGIVAEKDAVFDRLQEVFNLTNRESEIAELLATGMSAKRMSEKLFLAESTVSTHVKRIYRKCGVNSKQEFMDMVDRYRRR